MRVTSAPPPFEGQLHQGGRAITTTTLAAIYECSDCGERSTDRRCPDCNLFSRRLGDGGHCPNCDEPVLVQELFSPIHQAPSHTENLTGPIEKLAALHASGALTDEEFSAKKTDLLGRM